MVYLGTRFQNIDIFGQGHTQLIFLFENLQKPSLYFKEQLTKTKFVINILKYFFYFQKTVFDQEIVFFKCLGEFPFCFAFEQAKEQI